VSKQSKRERQRENREARRAYEEQLYRRRRIGRVVKWVAIVLIPIVAVGVFLLVSGGDDDTSEATPATRVGCRDVDEPEPKDLTYPSAPPLTIDPAKTYVATVDTSCGSFTIQLDATVAPQTVNSFVFLSNEGFYDGLSFHRVATDFVVQGGDPKGDGTGGPGYTLPDEPPPNGYQLGSVAMANSGPGTSGSQFFIVTSEQGAANLGGPPYLYSALGQVTEGIETVEKIDRLGSSAADPGSQAPRAPVVIDKVTITETPAVPAS
jgi:peptidylprolyl isomerase/peptidyl-prolyl cis-trans isomerase B (cyclophilin B)